MGSGNGTNGNGKGAPSLTQEQTKRLIEELETGVPIQAAVMAAGVPSRTFYSIKERAEKAVRGELRDWWDAIECARARGEVNLWQRVAVGGKGMMGALTVLERSYGYYRTERQEIEAKTETRGEVEYVLRRVPPREDPKASKKEDADDGR